MSWMGFRTNLSRHQPRIIRVGEIAQQIILNAELAVAAARERLVFGAETADGGRERVS